MEPKRNSRPVRAWIRLKFYDWNNLSTPYGYVNGASMESDGFMEVFFSKDDALAISKPQELVEVRIIRRGEQ